MSANDTPLPFPPDAQEIALMSAVENGGIAVASEGTDRYAIMDILVERGFMIKNYCPEALSVYQFSMSHQGMEAIK